MKGFLLYPDGEPVTNYQDKINSRDDQRKKQSSGYHNQVSSSSSKSGQILNLAVNRTKGVNGILATKKHPQILSISRSIPDIRIESLHPAGSDDNNNEDTVSEGCIDSPYDSITYNSTLGVNAARARNNLLRNIHSSNNELTITSMKSVSICEDNNSVYDTVTSYDGPAFTRAVKMSRRSSRVSILSGSSIQKVRRASKEFFEKITPIDKSGWKHRNWGGKSLEVIKAPIRFFLLLTTPTVDVDPHATPDETPMTDEEGDEVDRVEWNKPLSILHCITGPLFVIFATGYGLVFVGPVPLAVIVFLVAAGVSSLMIFTSKYETPPSYYKTYSSYLGFIVGVVWVYFISTEVVSNIRALGVAFNLSEPTIGMTILALGNCLLDFISNVSIAKKGYPRMAIGACLGSPLLALLLGVGIPGTIRTATSGTFIELEPTTLLVVIYIAIVSSLSLVVILCFAFKWKAKRWLGFVMISLYFSVIIIVFLVEFKIIPVSFTHVLNVY